MKQIEVKKEIVKEIVEQFKNAKSVVFVDYRGINVEQDTQLRRNFRKEGVVYKVYKNRLLVRALNELGITGYDPAQFEGVTSVAFSADEVAPAKILANAMNDYQVMNFKFGLLDGQVITKDAVVALSKMPTKATLIAMLLGMLQAPVAGLARALNEVAKKSN